MSHVQLGVQDAEDTCYVGKADGRLVYLVRPSVIDSDILSLTSLWPTFPIQHNGQNAKRPNTVASIFASSNNAMLYVRMRQVSKGKSFIIYVLI